MKDSPLAPGENQPGRNQCRPGARQKKSAWSPPEHMELATSINADFQEHCQGSGRHQRTIGVLRRTGKTSCRPATTSLSAMSRPIPRTRPGPQKSMGACPGLPRRSSLRTRCHRIGDLLQSGRHVHTIPIHIAIFLDDHVADDVSDVDLT
jgi:hypothetical protein